MKAPLWLPYLQSIVEEKNGFFTFVFNGGSEKVKLNNIQSILIYGESDFDLPLDIINKICGHGVPIVIHRRNIPTPIYISQGIRKDPDNTLEAQISTRTNKRKCTHIARQLLVAKMDSMKYLVSPIILPQYANIEQLRYIEASHAKKYWKVYFEKLGKPEWVRRPAKNIKKDNLAVVALDAVSKFLSGIQLRYIAYHHLSAQHGFLHTPTDYPALVYDSLEPYRGIFELECLKVFKKVGFDNNNKNWVGLAIEAVKNKLNDKTYVPLTRQIATYQELLHGEIISLKYYCLGNQRKFHIPMPGKPNGGRPAKINFLLYGRHAGKTDFWKVAREVSKDL